MQKKGKKIALSTWVGFLAIIQPVHEDLYASDHCPIVLELTFE